MMKSLFILLLFTATAAFTCNKDSSIVSGELLATYTYGQTQCADPWPRGADNEATGRNVQAYLKTRGIDAGWVSIKKTSDAAACLACTCTSGNTIYVGAPRDESTRQIMVQLGFKP